jgi:glycosyltransferase involved in cell wall biosynthesis
MSLANQRGVTGQYEVIVVDDGSRDRTADMVAEFARTAAFPVRFVTHAHDGFQLARCRNSGVRAAAAPYILFTDGDCVFPPDHLKRHLEVRTHGVVQAGECARLDEALSARLDENTFKSDEWLTMIPRSALRELRKFYRRSLAYQLVRHPEKPKLIGSNIGVWKSQLEEINGFDERYRGWGCEDDDLAKRLRRRGHRVRTVIRETFGYHLWHAPHTTAPKRWRDGVNIGYFNRPVLLTRCMSGLVHRHFEQLNVRGLADGTQASLARQVQSAFAGGGNVPDIEILFWPSEAEFTGEADCRLVFAEEGSRVPSHVARQAASVVTLPQSAGLALILGELQRLLGLAEPAARAAA